jgi:hypothetical protein
LKIEQMVKMPRLYLPLEQRISMLKRLLMQEYGLCESLKVARIGWNTWRTKVKPVLEGDPEFARFVSQQFARRLTEYTRYKPFTEPCPDEPRLHPLDLEGRKRLIELLKKMFAERRRGYAYP